MNKKGLSHIEIIVSFVLFVAAVIFIFYYFAPVLTTLPKSQGSVMNKILENVGTNVPIYTIIVNNTGNQINYASLSSVIAINLNENSNFAAYGPGAILPSMKKNRLIYIQNPNGWEAKDFIYIIFSDKVVENDSVLDVPILDDRFYTVSSIKNEKIYSEFDFIELNASYNSDYGALKDKMGIQSGNNFGFTLKLSDITLEVSREIPYGREVFSENRRIEVLRKNGLTEFANLEVQEW